MLTREKILSLVAKTLIILAIFIGGFFVGQNQALAPKVEQNQEAIASQNINVSLMLDFGNSRIKTYNDITLSSQASVFDLLKKITDENQLELKYQDYAGGMGVLIESINNIKNDHSANKYWQYWVNNKFATIGASNYQLKNHDVVEWKYTNQQINNN